MVASPSGEGHEQRTLERKTWLVGWPYARRRRWLQPSCNLGCISQNDSFCARTICGGSDFNLKFSICGGQLICPGSKFTRSPLAVISICGDHSRARPSEHRPQRHVHTRATRDALFIVTREVIRNRISAVNLRLVVIGRCSIVGGHKQTAGSRSPPS